MDGPLVIHSTLGRQFPFKSDNQTFKICIIEIVLSGSWPQLKTANLLHCFCLCFAITTPLIIKLY
jgi:hypothetical protein